MEGNLLKAVNIDKRSDVPFCLIELCSYQANPICLYRHSKLIAWTGNSKEGGSIWNTCGKLKVNQFVNLQTFDCPMSFRDRAETGALDQAALAHD